MPEYGCKCELNEPAKVEHLQDMDVGIGNFHVLLDRWVVAFCVFNFRIVDIPLSRLHAEEKTPSVSFF